MRTMQVEAVIDGNALKAVLPESLPAGTYHAVLVLDNQPEEPQEPARRKGADYLLTPISIPEWPADFTMRREELYGDAGR